MKHDCLPRVTKFCDCYLHPFLFVVLQTPLFGSIAKEDKLVTSTMLSCKLEFKIMKDLKVTNFTLNSVDKRATEEYNARLQYLLRNHLSQ